MGTQTALLISPHGLNTDEQDALTQVLEKLAMDGMQFQLQPDNVQQAHLVILDDETETGKNALLRARTGQVKLVFSSRNRSGKNLISIQKPINLTSLKELLIRIFQKMYSQLALQPGATVLTQVNDFGPQGILQPDSNLFVVLLDAKEHQQYLRIEAPGFPEIYVNGNSKSFATRTDQNDIKKILSVPFEQLAITPINEQDFNQNTNDMLIAALYRLLWVSGIYGSNGQLIAGHDTSRPVKLRAWPNFTRNDFLPQHLRLAAILARYPTTIDELVETTGINQAEIVNFYNAAYAVDLIEFAENTAAQIKAPPPPSLNDKCRSILSKLAARLKLGV